MLNFYRNKLTGKFSGLATVISLIILSFTQAYGQKSSVGFDLDSSKAYMIKLRDGSELFGKFLYKDSVSIVIKTESIPKIEIPFNTIKRIDVIEASNVKKGTYWFPNPNSTRYLFAPSAYNLKKGEGYYQNTYLFINSFNIGVTNNISVGGGLEFLSTFGSLAAGDFQPIFYITSKAGFKVTGKFHVAGGITVASIPGFEVESGNTAGVVYGIGTYGSVDHNLSGGLSWGFINGRFSSKPFVTISGMTRISKRTALITENWLIPGNGFYGIYSYGVRFFSEKLSVDLAFINNQDIAKALFLGLPIVNFAIKF